jgi:acetyl esterase/lipase
MYTKRGYVSIAAQYRLSGAAKWPAQIEDVKACIRWTRANANGLGIDPAKIAITGYSAGGLLALFAAGTQDRPEFEGNGGNAGISTKLAACFAFYAVTGPSWGGWRTSGLLPNGADDAAYRAAEPANYAKDFPPTEIFHGTADVTVPIESSQKLFEVLRQAKVPVEIHQFDGVPHEFDDHPEFGEIVAELADFFLDRHVLNPRTYPAFTPGRARG